VTILFGYPTFPKTRKIIFSIVVFKVPGTTVKYPQN